jgi:hypothetical protein
MTPTLFSLDDPADFDRFWAAYPRHDAKQDAKRAWSQIRPDAALVARILADLETRRWPTEKKYIPLPATYLRGGRYDDETGPTGGAGPDPPANRWRPSQATGGRIPDGHQWCAHEPMCDTDMDHVRRILAERDGAGAGL